MANKTSFPIYYPSDIHGQMGSAVPFLPFAVAPIAGRQDTIVVGPQFVGQLHDEFIDQLYRQSHRTQYEGTSFRAFAFQSRLCVSVVIPTAVTDKSGRGGKVLAFGLFVDKGLFSLDHNAIPQFMLMYLKILNRRFSLSLPETGAAELLGLIEGAFMDGEENQDTIRELECVLDYLLFASATIADLARTKRRWRLWEGLQTRAIPKSIVYPSNCGLEDVMHMFFTELCRGRGSGRKVGLYEGRSDFRDTIGLRPVSDLLDGVRKVKLRFKRGKAYLSIY